MQALHPAPILPAPPETLDTLLSDPRWGMHVRLGGDRRLIIRDVDGVYAFTATGRRVPVDPDMQRMILDTVPCTRGATVIEGHDYIGTFEPTDLLKVDGEDVSPEPYANRLLRLEFVFLQALQFPRLMVHRASDRKHGKLRDWQEEGEIGVVFRRMDAAYGEEGAIVSMLYVHTGLCRVSDRRVADRRLYLEVMDPATALWSQVGHVHVGRGLPFPPVGAVVEVTFELGADQGKPRDLLYLGWRRDAGAYQCELAQFSPTTHLVGAGERTGQVDAAA